MNYKSMNDFKKAILKLIFAALLVTSANLTGCKHKTEPVPQIQITPQTQEEASSIVTEEVSRPSPEIVTIYFACPEQDIDRFTKLAKAFHEQNPSISVEVISLEDVRDGATNQDIDHLVMSRVDAAYYWTTYEGAIDGSFLDLQPFIDADKNFDIDDYFPAMLTAFESQGGIWALPSDARVFYLLYDRDIFDAAGASYPETDWTREDFLTAAIKTTMNEEAGSQPQFGYWDDGFTRGAFISFFYNRSPNENTSLTARTIAEDVRWYTDMALTYNVMFAPLPTDRGFEQVDKLLQEGRIAMWGGEWLEYEHLKGERNLGISLYPTKEGPRALAHMYGYAISSGSQHPQESWRWLEFLSHQSISDGRSLPPRRSVAEATGYWEQFKPEDVDFVRFAAEHLAIVSSVKPGTQQLHTAIDSILSGASVEEALAEAETSLAERAAVLSESNSFIVESPDRQRLTTIRFAVSPDNTAIYHTLAVKFHELQGEIQVDLLPSNQADQSDCFAGQRGIDPLNPPNDLLSLESFLAVDSDLHLGDFHPALIESLRSRGELYGLPFQAQARAIFYNPQLFEEAGVSLPHSEWTLDDFLSLAVALTRGEGQNKQYGFLPFNGDVSDLRVFLSLQGVSTTDPAGQPYLNSPEMISALQWYANLALQHGVSPLFPTADDPVAVETRNTLVKEGRVAMWSDFTGIDRTYIWPEDITIGIAPLPIGTIKGTDFQTEGFFINSNTPQAEACWNWINFLSTQPELVTSMPARHSILESTEFATQVGTGELEAYQAMQSYENLLAEPYVVTYYDEIVQALYEVYAGSSPDRALQESQIQAEQSK